MSKHTQQVDETVERVIQMIKFHKMGYKVTDKPIKDIGSKLLNRMNVDNLTDDNYRQILKHYLTKIKVKKYNEISPYTQYVVLTYNKNKALKRRLQLTVPFTHALNMDFSNKYHYQLRKLSYNYLKQDSHKHNTFMDTGEIAFFKEDYLSFERDLVYVALHTQFGLKFNEIYQWVYGNEDKVTFEESLYFADPYTLEHHIPVDKVTDRKKLNKIKYTLLKAERKKYYPPFIKDHTGTPIVGLYTMYNMLKESMVAGYWEEHRENMDVLTFEDKFQIMDDAVTLFANTLEMRLSTMQISNARQELLDEIDDISQDGEYLNVGDNDPIPLTDNNIYFKTGNELSLGMPDEHQLRNNNVTMPSSWFYVNPIHETTERKNKELRHKLGISEYLPLPLAFNNLDIPLKQIHRQDLENDPNNKAYHEGSDEWFINIVDFSSDKLKGAVTKETYKEAEFIVDGDVVKVKTLNKTHALEDYQHDINILDNWIHTLKQAYTPVEPIVLTKANVTEAENILKGIENHIPELVLDENLIRKNSLCVCDCKSMFHPEDREYNGVVSKCRCRCHTRAKRLLKTTHKQTDFKVKSPDERLVRNAIYQNKKDSGTVKQYTKVEVEDKPILEPRDYSYFKHIIEEFPYYEIINYYQGNPPLSRPEYDINGKQVSTPELTIRYILSHNDVSSVTAKLRNFKATDLYDLTPIIIKQNDLIAPLDLIFNRVTDNVNKVSLSESVETDIKGKYIQSPIEVINLNKERDMLTPEQQAKLDKYNEAKKQVALKLRADLNMSYDEFISIQKDKSVDDNFFKFKEDYINDAFMAKLTKQMELNAIEDVETRDDENYTLDDVHCECCQIVEDEINTTNNSKFFLDKSNWEDAYNQCEEPCEKCLVAFSDSYHSQFLIEAEHEFEQAYSIGAFDALDVVKLFKRKLYKIDIPVAPKFEGDEKVIFELNGETLVKAPDYFYYNPMTVTKEAPSVFDLVLPNTSDNDAIVKALKHHLNDNSAPPIVRGSSNVKWIVKDGVNYRVLRSKNLGTMQVVTLIENDLFNEKLAKRKQLEHDKSQIMQETNRLLDSLEEDVKRDSITLSKLREHITTDVKPFSKDILLNGLLVDEHGKTKQASPEFIKLFKRKLFTRDNNEDNLNSVELLTEKFKDIAPNNLTDNVDIGLLITLLFQDKLVNGLTEISGEAVNWLKPTAEALRDYYDSDPTFASYLEAVTTLSIKHMDVYHERTLPKMLKSLDIESLSNSTVASNLLKHIRLSFQESKTAILQKALSDEDEKTLQAFKVISKDEIFLDALERAYESKDVDVLSSLLSAKQNLDLHDGNTTCLLSGRVINEENVMREALTILDGIKDFRLTTEKETIHETLTDIIQMRLMFPISSVVHLVLAYALEERFKFNVGAKSLLPSIVEALGSLRTKPEEETRLVNGIVALANRVVDGRLTGAETIISELGYAIQQGISTRGEYVAKSNGNLQLAETYMIEDGITRELYNRAIAIISADDARTYSEASVNKAVFLLSKYSVKKIAVESQILLSRVATNALGITVTELDTLKKSVITAIEQLNLNASDSTDSMLITDSMTEEDYELLDDATERVVKLRTGFSLINGFNGGGLNPCDLVVIGALAGNHKTGITMNMFIQMMLLNNGLNYVDEDDNLPTAVWYSLEDKQGLVFRKMAQIVMRLTTGVFVDLTNVKISVLHKYMVQTFKKHNWRFMFQFLNPANSTATRIEQSIDGLNSKGANVKILTIDYMGKMSCAEQSGGIHSQQLKAMVSQARNHAVRKEYLLMTPWQLGPSAGRMKQLDEDKPRFITTLSDAQAYKDISDLKTEIDLEILVDRVIPLAPGIPYTMSIARGKEKDTSGATLHNTPLHGFIPFNKESGTAPLSADIFPVYDDKGYPVFDDTGEIETRSLKHGFVTKYTELRTIANARNKINFYPSGTVESIPHYAETIRDLPINTLEQLNALVGLDKYGNAIPNKWKHVERITADDIKSLSDGVIREKIKINYLPPLDLNVIEAKADSVIKTSKPLHTEESLQDRLFDNKKLFKDVIKQKHITDNKFEKIKRDYNINPIIKLNDFTPAVTTTMLNKRVTWKTKIEQEYLPTDIKNPLNTAKEVDSMVKDANKIAQQVKQDVKKRFEELDEPLIAVDKKKLANDKRIKEIVREERKQEQVFKEEREKRKIQQLLKEEKEKRILYEASTKKEKPTVKIERTESALDRLSSAGGFEDDDV